MTKEKNSLVFLSGALILFFTCLIVYGYKGYSNALLVFWIFSLFLLGLFISCLKKPSLFLPLNRKDLVFLSILALILFPVFLYNNYELPQQATTDEFVILTKYKFITGLESPDLFGLGHHTDYPTLLFYVYGHLTKLLGEINFDNIRTVHAFFGLVIPLLIYGLFRLFASPFFSFGVALLIGFSHSFVVISRMGLTVNNGLLMQTIALFFFFIAIQKKEYVYAYVGGVISGLTFYFNLVGKGIFFVWASFLMLTVLFTAKSHFLKVSWWKKNRHYVWLGLASILGFVVTISPMILATLISNVNNEQHSYTASQLLIFKEGRELQQKWVRAETIEEGVIINIKNGILLFNQEKTDLGWIYTNPEQGFVDPLTGILLWTGIIFVLARKKGTKDFLMLAGFFFYWLLFIFILTKTPNYTRSLIILPFVMFFVMTAITEIGKKINCSFPLFGKKTSYVFCTFILFAIVALNGLILYDYTQKGFKYPEEVGSTIRYLEEKKSNLEHSYYIITDGGDAYFFDSNENKSMEWIRAIIHQNQSATVLHASELDRPFEKPFTLFMRGHVWAKNRYLLKIMYPDAKKINMYYDGMFTAIEVNEDNQLEIFK